MNKTVHYTKPLASITAPPSKSDAQRAVISASLAESPTIIKNIGRNDDILFLLKLINNFGSKVEKNLNEVIIIPGNMELNNSLNIGESGLATRIVTSVASLFFSNYTIIGQGSILKRSMNWFEKHLPKIGLNINSNNGYLPLNVNGNVKGGAIKIDGSESSQYLTGLLFTLPKCEEDSIIMVNNPTSKPYIDLTLKTLNKFNIKVDSRNYTEYRIKGNQKFNLQGDSYVIEGDYSGASFWIVYGLLNNGIKIKGLDKNSTQADKKILEIIELVNGNYKWNNDSLEVIPSELKPFNFNAENCPDLFPVLVVLAAGIKGKSTIIGTNRLINKESNRLEVLVNEFSKLGLDIRSDNNEMIINGDSTLMSGEINSNNDHRIAMAAAIASNLTKNGIEVINSECINKSYPMFWDQYVK